MKTTRLPRSTPLTCILVLAISSCFSNARAEVVQFTNVLNTALFAGWSDTGQGAATNISDGNGGSYMVGWIQGPTLPTVGNNNIMGGWGWPDDPGSRSPDFPRGYSWNGTHDSGWAASVGFYVAPTGSAMTFRGNGNWNTMDSAPCVVWTCGVGGTATFTFSIAQSDAQGALFGIYDYQTGAWASANGGDNIQTATPNAVPRTVANPNTSNVEQAGYMTYTKTVAPGDRFVFASRANYQLVWTDAKVVVQTETVNSDLNADLFNGWMGRGMIAANNIPCAGGGTLGVGWFDGNFAGNVPSTMRSWAWPDGGTGTNPGTEAAVGYSWNGTHDSGWVAYVGYENLNPSADTWDGATVRPFAGKNYTAARQRSNGGFAGEGSQNGSSTAWIYVAPAAGPLKFDVSAFQGNNSPGSGEFCLGVYSVADAQWLGNSSTFVGNSASKFTGSGNVVVTDMTVAAGDQYFIAVHNFSGAIDCRVGGYVSAVGIPRVNQQPKGKTLSSGQSFTLSAVAGGSLPLSYQWRLNGTNLPGETGTTLSRANATTAQAGNYDLVLINPSGSVTSAVAVVTVTNVIVVAQLADLFPPGVGGTPAASHAWPGNFGGSPPGNAVNLLDTSGNSSWRVGWVDSWSSVGWGNPAAATVTTMGGWIWPNENSAQRPTVQGAAQGYAWYGNHDTGWAGHVGFETGGSGAMPVRNNGGSFPLLQWTASAGGVYRVSFTLGGDWSNWPNDYTGFGIWSTHANAYVGDTLTMLGWAPPTPTLPRTPTPSGPYTITASNVVLSAGERLYFLARTLGSTGNSSYQFQGLTITAVSPLANNLAYTRSEGMNLKIPVSELLAAASDPTGYALSLQSLGASGTGANISISGGMIFYTPSTGANSNSNDSFTYTVSNGQGGTAVGTVAINVVKSVGLVAQNVSVSNNVATIQFFGLPNTAYVVQTTTNNIPTTNWWPISTNTTAANGLMVFIDSNATNAMQFYRTAQP